MGPKVLKKETVRNAPLESEEDDNSNGHINFVENMEYAENVESLKNVENMGS